MIRMGTSKKIFNKLRNDPMTTVTVVVYTALFVFYCTYELMGLVSHNGSPVTFIAAPCMIALIVLLYFRSSIFTRWPAFFYTLRPLLHPVFIFAGFYLLERPYSNVFFEMSLEYVIPNLVIVALLYGIVYLLGQRSKASIIIFLALCFLVGTANYFVITFKGQPILPSDLFALSTAAAVSGGYTYAINDNVLEALLVLISLSALVLFLPKAPLNTPRAAINTACALVVGLTIGMWFDANDIEESYACTVDVWDAHTSYATQGSTLCFLKRAQDLVFTAPEGYSQERVQEILEPYNSYTFQAGEVQEQESPTVIVVMNETFSDLSMYENIAEYYQGPTFYNSLTEENTLAKGNAYVSALGGGTCNSEFEFLTGCSMSTLGGGIYPYVLYDLDVTENLAGYFSTYGYSTTAIHPAEASNWRRDRVYSQLGFETFYDIAAFEESDTMRGLTTDRATYDLVLDLLEQNEDPQFIFDVTIQNHGGYETGYLLENADPAAVIEEYSALDEYLACIEKSDQDLEYFISALSQIDRPIILCFFGDHQPEFADTLSEEALGKSVSEFTLDEVQMRYTVPYMMWANYEVTLPEKTLSPSSTVGSPTTVNQLGDGSLPYHPRTNTSSELSLNYLGAKVVEATGLPPTNYQNYLLGIQGYMPAMNLNGYMDAAGNWYWINEDSEVRVFFDEYAVVQYNALFNSYDS